MPYAPTPFPERFWPKVEKTDTCWLWTGAKTPLGYGKFNVGKGRIELAHRTSLALAGVTIPPGFDVDHLCRVPSCVRPDHLEPVTHAENMARAPYTAAHFQSDKTHCPQGHEYTPENTHLRRNSSDTLSRECRTCRRERPRKSRRKGAGPHELAPRRVR